MLGKLLRYEFKSIGRLFLPLYGLSVLLAVANRFTSYNPKWEYELPEFVLMFAFMAILMGLALITFIQCVLRFKRNLLGDEGYLMMTLPVERMDLILSKLIAAVAWTIIGGCVGLISLFILMPTNDIKIMGELFIDIFRYGGFNGVMFLVYMIIIGILGVAAVYTPIYTALSLGHISNKNKMLASFGWYFVNGIVLNILSSGLVLTIEKVQLWDLLRIDISGKMVSHLIFIGFIVCLLIYNMAHIMITDYVLKNKLNLE